MPQEITFQAVNVESKVLEIMINHPNGVPYEILRDAMPPMPESKILDGINNLFSQNMIHIHKEGNQLVYMLKETYVLSKIVKFMTYHPKGVTFKMLEDAIPYIYVPKLTRCLFRLISENIIHFHKNGYQLVYMLTKSSGLFKILEILTDHPLGISFNDLQGAIPSMFEPHLKECLNKLMSDNKIHIHKEGNQLVYMLKKTSGLSKILEIVTDHPKGVSFKILHNAIPSMPVHELAECLKKLNSRDKIQTVRKGNQLVYMLRTLGLSNFRQYQDADVEDNVVFETVDRQQ